MRRINIFLTLFLSAQALLGFVFATLSVGKYWPDSWLLIFYAILISQCSVIGVGCTLSSRPVIALLFGFPLGLAYAVALTLWPRWYWGGIVVAEDDIVAVFSWYADSSTIIVLGFLAFRYLPPRSPLITRAKKLFTRRQYSLRFLFAAMITIAVIVALPHVFSEKTPGRTLVVRVVAGLCLAAPTAMAFAMSILGRNKILEWVIALIVSTCFGLILACYFPYYPQAPIAWPVVTTLASLVSMLSFCTMQYAGWHGKELVESRNSAVI